MKQGQCNNCGNIQDFQLQFCQKCKMEMIDSELEMSIDRLGDYLYMTSHQIMLILIKNFTNQVNTIIKDEKSQRAISIKIPELLLFFIFLAEGTLCSKYISRDDWNLYESGIQKMKNAYIKLAVENKFLSFSEARQLLSDRFRTYASLFGVQRDKFVETVANNALQVQLDISPQIKKLFQDLIDAEVTHFPKTFDHLDEFRITSTDRKRRLVTNTPLAELKARTNYIPLTNIPKVYRNTPNVYSLDWEIPQKVNVTILRVRDTYFFMVKIMLQKKHWWSKSKVTFHTKSEDVNEVIQRGFEFLGEHGYQIDPTTITE